MHFILDVHRYYWDRSRLVCLFDERSSTMGIVIFFFFLLKALVRLVCLLFSDNYAFLANSSLAIFFEITFFFFFLKVKLGSRELRNECTFLRKKKK